LAFGFFLAFDLTRSGSFADPVSRFQDVVANTPKLFRQAAVGFIDWLDLFR
jgi:hypothetical protein